MLPSCLFQIQLHIKHSSKKYFICFFGVRKKFRGKSPPWGVRVRLGIGLGLEPGWLFPQGRFFPRTVFSHQVGINPTILQHASLVFSFRHYLNDSTTFFLWLVFILIWNNRLPYFMKQRISNRLTTFLWQKSNTSLSPTFYLYHLKLISHMKILQYMPLILNHLY